VFTELIPVFLLFESCCLGLALLDDMTHRMPGPFLFFNPQTGETVCVIAGKESRP